MTLLDAHNDFRATHGKKAFLANAKLNNAALVHANWMANHNLLTHQGIGEASPWNRIIFSGYHYFQAGENIAAGQISIDAVMIAWIHSPLHLENILGSYNDMGEALIISTSGIRYWCVCFGSALQQTISPGENISSMRHYE